ncbi:MAG: nuclear transport factor 2 family protein [Alphaproteobacteria bacterium]|nr:nuclear transport factor 2 family protein [Alphaproteobacteria bacterium]
MSREEVLFVNEAFYQAFAEGDAAAMDALWAVDLPVACLHPGWEPLVEREAIVASWRAILQDPPPVRCLAPRVFDYGETAFVICFEAIRGQALVATNLFAREGGLWRLVHHQAGPTRAEPPADPQAHEPPTIN